MGAPCLFPRPVCFERTEILFSSPRQNHDLLSIEQTNSRKRNNDSKIVRRFSRAWIVQEAALSHEPLLIFGSWTINLQVLDYLQLIAVQLEVKFNLSRLQRLQVLFSRGAQTIRHIQSYLQNIRLNTENQLPFSAGSILRFFGFSEFKLEPDSTWLFTSNKWCIYSYFCVNSSLYGISVDSLSCSRWKVSWTTTKLGNWLATE